MLGWVARGGQLVRAGLATATAECVVAGNRKIKSRAEATALVCVEDIGLVDRL